MDSLMPKDPNTFVTSDLHFGHKNIIKFEPEFRSQFTDVDDMDAKMIDMWNSEVTPEDTVYIIGDCGICSAAKLVRIIERLKGEKHLVVGNHDEHYIKNYYFTRLFKSISYYINLGYKTDCGHFNVIMSHYPMLHWDGSHHGSIHLHGHLHSAPSGMENYRAFNVGVDYTKRIVVPLAEIVEAAMTRPIKPRY